MYAKDEETKHKVNIVAILSMTDGEIDETLDIVRMHTKYSMYNTD